MVDRKDRILVVNPEWTAFALANGGSAVLPEKILGRELWSQISDPTVRAIYRLLVERARLGHLVRFRYRCDSPTHRRTFEMNVRAGAEDQVIFDSLLVHDEERPSVALLEEGRRRDERMVRVCSWCQRVALPQGQWVDIEEAVQVMGYLENPTLPRMSHGICPECLKKEFGDTWDEAPPT
jgi:hypothetical protein